MPYIGKDPVIGEFIELDALTASATADYALTRNGAAYKPATVNNLLVSINGVIQGGSTMSLSGNTLTVGATLSSSDTIDFVRVLGSVGNVSEPTDGSVTSAKLANDIAVSTLDVATIRASNGTTAATIQTDGTVIMGGNLISTAMTTNTTRKDISSGSGFQDTGLYMPSITPKSTASKFLMNWNITCHTNSTNGTDEFEFAVYRSIGGGSDVELVTSINFVRGSSGVNDHTESVSYLDAPSTTSAVVYKLYAKIVAGNIHINPSNKRQVFIIQELAG
jgi:hypothetical protein